MGLNKWDKKFTRIQKSEGGAMIFIREDLTESSPRISNPRNTTNIIVCGTQKSRKFFEKRAEWPQGAGLTRTLGA